MNFTRLSKKFLSLALTVAMLLSLCAPTITVVAEGVEDSTADNKLNYVSIGDSMTNGYGFIGYEQGQYTGEDFLNGEGVYGAGAYPLQFEAYLTEQGYDVTHTKLAPSGLLAEDLLFLLGGERPVDNGWHGYRDYVGGLSDDVLAPFFQEAVENADIITLCIGNASFGAFLVDRITNVIGIMGSDPVKYEQLTLENGLALLESEEA